MRAKADEEDFVADYKRLLRDLIDRRPSGTRLKIARALGKHKSFVSQIVNPGYAIPVPAKHLATIFDICHFSPEERRDFMRAYQRAHPGRHLRATEEGARPEAAISIEVPSFTDPQRRSEVIEMIRQFADQTIALARRWDQAGAATNRGGPSDEETDKRG